MRLTLSSFLRFGLLSRRYFSASNGVIEIERKFAVKDEIVAHCQKYATNSKSIVLIDTYFDNVDYDLTKRDMWLRERNDAWEIKVPVSHLNPVHSKIRENGFSGIDHYVEFTKEEDIARYISSSTKADNLAKISYDSLSNVGITPFCRIKTSRTRYFLNITVTPFKHAAPYTQKVHIDIDDVVYDHELVGLSKADSLEYRIGEIEFASSVPENLSSNDIMKTIFKELNIDTKPVRGKLLEYLHRYRREHYDALSQSGQLASKGITS